MQLSHYLKAWPYPEKAGYHLLFSTKKASLVLLPDEALARLNQGIIPDQYAEDLIKLGMLVPDPDQERLEVFDYLNEINRVNHNLDVAIILGLECNFRCIYCYEGSLKAKLAMSRETADSLLLYLKSRLSPDTKRLRLDFYGGEPLLYTGLIKYIAANLKPYVEEQGANFSFSLVTNGSLLSVKTVAELVPLGLSAAKVTVDGPAATHDQCRPFVSGRPSFEVIMKNVKDCCEMTRIGLGGNFSRDNYLQFPGLFNYLVEYGLGPEKIGNMQFAPATQTRDAYANPEFTNGCVTSSEQWIAAASLLLREEVLKRGYKTPKLGLSPCMVDIHDSFVIHFDGKIFKCVAMIGHEQFAVGDIWNGVADYHDTYHTEHWKQNEACRECVYLPMCFGGCRNMAFQRSGSMAKVDCWREFYDAVLEETIKQDVRYRYQPA